MMFVRLAANVAAGLVVSLAAAQAHAAYPTGPIRLIVPQSAGSGVDSVARILSDRMSQTLGQSVVVENKPGANGVIATAYVAKAKPDGYTLLLSGSSPMTLNPGLYKHLPYDPIKDFTYIAGVAENPFVLVASKASGLKSFAELKKAATEHPGRYTFASAGIGNSTHLATEMVAYKTGIKLMHVPFNGSGPAFSSVIGGQTDLMSSVVGPALPQLQAGAATPLLIIGAGAIPELPGVPSARDEGLDLPTLPTWTAVVGPAGMDPAVVKVIEKAVQDAQQDSRLQAQFKAQYLSIYRIAGPALTESIKNDIKVWTGLIHEFGIKAE
ncbi:Bug family tripartite tricarboxylate transporter substrate binding protein [Bordetella genomosp. 8]|nr:tripartite tricarboxylate transporter substrate binding protein [Bordetella genomosp. 8]